MLKALPLETFYSSVEELNQDFSDIINEKLSSEEVDSNERLTCYKCKFRASSKNVLRTHNSFVHDCNFFKCKVCGSKTRTSGGMKLHNKNAHMILIQDEETDNDDSSLEENDSDEEDDINIEYEYSEQSGTFKGNKPAFVHAVIAIK